MLLVPALALAIVELEVLLGLEVCASTPLGCFQRHYHLILFVLDKDRGWRSRRGCRTSTAGVSKIGKKPKLETDMAVVADSACLMLRVGGADSAVSLLFVRT